MSALEDRMNAALGITSEEVTSEGGPLTVSNLLDDDKFSTVATYMEDRTGMTEADYSREEIRDSFVNSMRGFNSGNSIDVIQEMNHLYQGEGDDLTNRRATAASAYELWDSLGGAFNRNTTTGEKVDAVGDYARSLILDPVNIVSLGFGKIGGNIATRGASKSLQAIARAAGEAAGSAAVANGAKTEAVTLAITQAQSRVMTRGFQELAATGGEEAVKSAGRRRVVGDIAGSAVLDSAAGVAADAGMQSVNRMTDRQEGYSATRGAVSALGGVVGAGLRGSLILARGWGPTDTAGSSLLRGEETFEANLLTRNEPSDAAAVIAARSEEEIAQQSLRGFLTPFKELVAEGRKINADGIPTLEFVRFYGGLKKVFNDSGIPIDSLNARLGQRRAGWYNDVIKDKNFPAEWRDAIEEATSVFQTSNGNILDLDELMLKGAEVASVSGSVLGSLGAASRAGRLPTGSVDEDVVSAGLRSLTGGQDLDGPGGFAKWAGNFQNGFIRMLVTHPATTALNVVGWANASGMKSTVDMIKGTLYGGYSVLKYAAGDAVSAASYRRLAANAFQANRQKLINLVNPASTQAEVLDFLTHRPEAQRSLFSYLSGGIKNEEAVIQLNRILDDAPDARTGVTRAMDFTQVMYGVKAQDVLTKSQEFMYSLDLNIRNKYNMSYKEFMQQEDIFTILKDPQKGAKYQDFMEIEGLAVQQALRNVFAKKMGKSHGTVLQKTANVLEEARNMPVIGALLPFGQFFNNSLVFMSDHIGVSLALKPFVKQEASGLELLTKASVGWGIVGFATVKEMQNLEDGLAWHEERNSDGKIVSRLYDFPLSFWKIIGRMGAHVIRDKEVPKPLFEEFVNVFTLPSVTRGLGKTAGEIQQMATEVFAADKGYAEVASEVLSGTVGLYASGGTRFLDPLNTALAFAEGEDYVAPSRNVGNKNLNNALRYTDQIVDSLIGLENIPVIGEDIDKAYNTQNYNAVNGRNIGVNPGRISGSREVPVTSSIGRLFNDIGKPQWQTNIRMDNKEAQEVYEQYLFPLLEYRADQLLSGDWETLSLGRKEIALRQTMTLAREEIKDSFAATPSGPRAEAGLIININNLKNSGRQAFDDMLGVFSTDEESLGDLSLPQLQLLFDSIQSAQDVQGDREAAVLEP